MPAFIKRDNLIFVFLLLQIIFWFSVKSIKPDMAVIPTPPNELTIKASSLGDEQFYFRTLGFQLQNAGDTFGRVTPLKNYDYERLTIWFNLLDTLDGKSNFIPSLAAYYYSNSQYTLDNRYIVDYLVKHADRHPEDNWWWYAQAAYIAKHKLQDLAWALEISKKLAAIPAHVDMPFWARQMPAFIMEDMGELEQAYIIIKDIIDNMENIPEGEMNFMMYFIQDRLNMIQKFQEEREAQGLPVVPAPTL